MQSKQRHKPGSLQCSCSSRHARTRPCAQHASLHAHHKQARHASARLVALWTCVSASLAQGICTHPCSTGNPATVSWDRTPLTRIERKTSACTACYIGDVGGHSCDAVSGPRLGPRSLSTWGPPHNLAAHARAWPFEAHNVRGSIANTRNPTPVDTLVLQLTRVCLAVQGKRLCHTTASGRGHARGLVPCCPAHAIT